MDAALPVAQVAATVTLNLALALMVGASVALLRLGSGSSAWSRQRLPVLRTIFLCAAAAALLASVALLWFEAAAMAEVAAAEAWPAVRSLVGSTQFGFGWTVGVGARAVLAASAGARLSARVALLRFCALALYAYSRSIIGHAGADGNLSLAAAVDACHLLLASLWVGEVLLAAFATLPHVHDQTGASRAEVRRYLGSLSNSATIALAGIAATGLFNAWRAVGVPAALLTTEYGNVLALKLVFVAGAVALGGFNRFAVLPGLHTTPTGPALRKFIGVLRIEAVALSCALAAAAVLSATAPPGAG